MTTPQDGPAPLEHRWEGTPEQVFHCTQCGLVVQSTDTVYSCQPLPTQRPRSEGDRA